MTGKTVWLAVAVCATGLVLASCGNGSSGGAAPPRTPSAGAALTSAAAPPPTSGRSVPPRTTVPTRTSASTVAAFPADLVGAWAGDGSARLTFTADGRYDGTTKLGTGQASVSGDQITFVPSGGTTVETTWSVQGGRLYLGTKVYLRDDAATGSVSLVGTWDELDGYARFRFAADGTYSFTDPAHNRSSQGRYSVAGTTFTITPTGRAGVVYGLRYDGTPLTFLTADGSSAGEYLRVG